MENIKPFVDLIGGLIEFQAAEPVERIAQRPESGNWTSPPPGPDRTFSMRPRKVKK
jgi:hypothetical protein